METQPSSRPPATPGAGSICDVMIAFVNSLAPADRELVLQLFDDVGVLEAQFAAGIPSPSAARAVFAPILRRWIAEALFFKAQKLILPKQASFAIRDNGQAINLCETGVLEHWMGLVWFGKIEVSIAQRNLATPESATRPLGEDAKRPDTLQKAGRFFDQKMLFWKNAFYTRAEIIKIHANSLGGVHFDLWQNEQEIDEIKNYFGFEIVPGQSQMILGQEIATRRMDPRRRQFVYDATELIAMDTARVFASAMRASQESFFALLDARDVSRSCTTC